MDWKNQYHKNGHTAHSNLQIRYYSYQISTSLFTELEETILKFIWKKKRAKIATTILGKKNKSCRHHITQLQTILQGYSNQNSMVLVQKQTHRPIEENTEPRNRAAHLQPSIFDKVNKNKHGEETPYSINGAGITG